MKKIYIEPSFEVIHTVVEQFLCVSNQIGYTTSETALHYDDEEEVLSKESSILDDNW